MKRFWTTLVVAFLLVALSPWSIRDGGAADDATFVDRNLSPGDTFRDCPVCPEMVVVPAGSFVMGSPADEAGHVSAEAPLHQVTIDAPFAIAKYETTAREWSACRADGHCLGLKGFPHEGSDRLPVTGIAWMIIPSFIEWLKAKTGHTYRLPSEAEWEYVARAGSQTAYAYGDNLAIKDANFGDYIGDPVEVGSYRPNAWGVYDMHGNAAEWVEDCWISSYAAPTDGSAWAPDCLWRVWRGGSWSSDVTAVRSAARDYDLEGSAGLRLGFRVIRSITQ